MMKTTQIQRSNQEIVDARAKARRESNAKKGVEFLKRTLTPDKRPRDMQFCKLINRQVMAAIPDMKAGVSYTLKEICGTDFWAALDRGKAIKAGLCMAWMVREGQLPLVQGKDKGVTKTYKLKLNA